MQSRAAHAGRLSRSRSRIHSVTSSSPRRRVGGLTYPARRGKAPVVWSRDGRAVPRPVAMLLQAFSDGLLDDDVLENLRRKTQ